MRWLHLLQISFQLLRLRFIRNEANHRLARQAISEQLGEMGGIAMKIGQLVADVGQAEELRDLLDREKARPLTEMLPVLEQELGQPVEAIFKNIEPSSCAASLGQVHKATLKNGETVAVKIQYPYIADAVDSELKLAGLMPVIGPVKKWGMDLNAYKQTLASNMHRELDYRSESERQQLLLEQLQVDGLVIPVLYPQYSGKRVLIQSWEEGELLDQILDWPKSERMLIARTLLLTLFQSLFKVGEVHGDPHMGNAFYRHDNQGKPVVVLLDYGCTIRVTENVRLALLQLILQVREGNLLNVLASFAAMGFEPNKLTYIARELPLITQILFKPFVVDEPFKTEHWRIKQTFEQILGEKKWWFRSAGPSELFLLMRAFQGIVRQLDRLQVSLPWWLLLKQAVGDNVIQAAREFNPAPLPVELTGPGEDISCIAHSLRVRVNQNENVIVDMKLPALAALELEDIMPAEVLEKVNSEGDIDLQQLNQTLLETHFKPGDIINFSRQDKEYRIWLE